MAKKSVEGQMDLFELFGSVEELEEKVKGVPEVPEEIESEIEVRLQEKLPEEKKAVRSIDIDGMQSVMQKTFFNQVTGQTAVIAYLNYNKVYQKFWDAAPIIYQFENAKEAVDYYVTQMSQFSEDKQLEVSKQQETLMAASLIPWENKKGN